MVNLRTGAKRCNDVDVNVHGLGLTRAGSLAWLDFPDPPVSATVVRKLEAGGHDPVILDSGADIDRTSFAVGGNHIYWTKAGAPRSATMP